MRRVLVVDDEERLRHIVRRALLSLGEVEIEDFGSAAEALGRAAEVRYAVALLDLEMPGINGVQLGLRLHVLQPGLPLILVSGVALAELHKAASFLGAVGYVQKPFKTQELIACVETYLGH